MTIGADKSAGLGRATGTLLSLLVWGLSQAQNSPPQTSPRAPLSIPQGVPPEMARALESQRAGFESYQSCVAGHRRDVDLHYAASQVIQFREQRAKLEAIFAADPGVRQKYPGGVDQMGATAFARYRSLGGTARSIAEVEPVATPCPPPVPNIPQARVAPSGSAPISQSRQMIVMDNREAERKYRLAADKGDAEAMVALGRLLTPERPTLGRRDDEEAARWYRKAAEQGHVVGMVQIADALQNGRGVARDKAAALEWYRRAAEKGNAVATGWVRVAENCKNAGKAPASCL